jgi:hypothetical protein
VFTARYGLNNCIKRITFRLQRVNYVPGCGYHVTRKIIVYVFSIVKDSDLICISKFGLLNMSVSEQFLLQFSCKQVKESNGSKNGV